MGWAGAEMETYNWQIPGAVLNGGVEAVSGLSRTLCPTQHRYSLSPTPCKYTFRSAANINTLPVIPALLRGHAKLPGPLSAWRRHARGRTEGHSEEESPGE